MLDRSMRTAMLCALISCNAAEAAMPEMQPSAYLRLSFAEVQRLPQWQLGLQWSWSDEALRGLAQNMDLDLSRDAATVQAATRLLRDHLPPLLHLGFSNDDRFEVRANGGLMAWHEPLRLSAGGEQTGGWRWSTGRTVGVIVAGAAVTALALSGSGSGNEAENNSGDARTEKSCNGVGSDGGTVYVNGPKCESPAPGMTPPPPGVTVSPPGR